MELKSGYFSLVIVGDWNKSIFNPEWVGEYIFDIPGAKIKVEIPTDNISLNSFRYTYNHVSFNISGARLQFSAENNTDEEFNYIGEIALKISRLLPHTPTIAFGINHVIKVKPDELTDSISINDDLKFKDYTIQNTTIKRKISLDDCVLTFSYYETDSHDIEFDFNYNYDIKTLDDFTNYFDVSKIVDYKKKSFELLKDIYSLKDAD